MCPIVIKMSRWKARVEEDAESQQPWVELSETKRVKWFAGSSWLLAELWLGLSYLDFGPLTQPDKVSLDNCVIPTKEPLMEDGGAGHYGHSQS